MSLTKATLLENTTGTKADKLGEFFGMTLYVKPVSELMRSRRVSSLYDAKKDQVRPDAMQRARCLTIVDHICNEDGENIFTEKDINDVMEMDAAKVDILVGAIEEWQSTRVKKLQDK